MNNSKVLYNQKCSICNYEIQHYKKRSSLSFVDCSEMDDKYLKRAGLDYWHLLEIEKFRNFNDFFKSNKNKRIISFSKKNGIFLNEFIFKNEDILLFGREDIGLPDEIINQSNALVSIYMPKKERNSKLRDGVRSLNLSVACGIAIYEANKQLTKNYYQ